MFSNGRPRGLMDMASDFGSEDCGFESRRGQMFFFFYYFFTFFEVLDAAFSSQIYNLWGRKTLEFKFP